MEALLWVLAEESNPEIRRTLSRYITTWRTMTADITGRELQKMGLKAGPAVGRILHELLVAKLDHDADTPARQYELAQRLVRSELGKGGKENVSPSMPQGGACQQEDALTK